MLLRRRTASRSLSLPHIPALRRPRLTPNQSSIHPAHTHTAGRRLLVTRQSLAPWQSTTTTAPLGAAVAHRALATAIDDRIRQDSIPFVDHLHAHPMPNSYMPSSAPLPLYQLRAFDPASTLHVKVQDEPLPRSRVSSAGLPGGVDELVSVFDACLDTDMLERAAKVLQRFAAKGSLPDPELIALHNQYLRAGIDRALDKPELEWAQSLHQWFEVEIRGNEIPFTHETIACMLKISLLSTQQPRLTRLVTRYLDMLPEESVLSVLDAGILNQQDFGTIATIYKPTSNLVLEELDSIITENQTQESISTQVPSSEPSEIKSTSVPEVLAVPQKGLGLKTLRGVLSFFNQIDGQDLSKLPIDELREIQLRLEHDCVDAAISRWRDENQSLAKMGRNAALSKPELNTQLYDWHNNLEKNIKAEFELFAESEEKEKKSAEDIERCQYAPFMRQSTPTRLAAVTIMGVISCITHHGADKGVPLSTLLTNLAKVIEEDVRFQARQKRKQQRQKSFVQARRQRAKGAMDTVQNDTSETQQNATTTSNPALIDPPKYDITSWPALVKAKVGARLLSALLEEAKIKVVREHPDTKALVSQVQPALARGTMHRKGKRIGIILPNRVLVEMMKKEPRGDFLAKHLPMLVEPRPWTNFEQGGFLEYPSHLVRIKNGERDQRIYAEAAIERGDLDQVSKGLDVLGRTAWRVNRPVFDVMLEAWNTGEAIANIPPLNPDIPVPEEPESSMDPLARRQWLKQIKLVENEKSGLHSERCFMNFQLDIARAFRDQSFYFPHNMDFRGRAYPIPAYLNHMGADHVRGLLCFAKGKELGEGGLRWLKVQLANVFGFDKASLDERENFATDHIKDIMDSATNPLKGQKWWLKAEDPWQCLAACFELKAALECPDPTKFVSYLPVHQDGTCNGLQHYAALGGDQWGAEQVNLLPGDRPADVYSAVADLVKASIKEDLAADNFMAKAIDGKITRKVVKQTVMTNVYGVTFMGAKAQVLKQIDAAYPDIDSQTGVPAVILASYVATKIFKALSSMFRGAHDIQYWLGECAGRVCRALTPEQLDRIAREGANTPVKTKKSSGAAKKMTANEAMEALLDQFRSTIVWTTPLRMPIVQPYRKTTSRVISTCLQELTLQIPERSDPVNRRKQLQAFPPNFIHSLDASHMLLSALECDALGLSFAAVHDSFWTHAADVDVMNRVLRDAFIRIHSEDVIGRLASEFQVRYGGSLYLAKIDRRSDLGAEIVALRRSNRQSMREELLQERERQRLLASSDPVDVKKGKEMVTPGSLYEKMGSTEPLPLNDEMDHLEIDDGASNVQAAEEDLSSAENPDQVKRLINVTHFEAKMKKMNAVNQPQRKQNDDINIWLPLDFPAIPVKGDFDVTQLKSSKYFFS